MEQTANTVLPSKPVILIERIPTYMQNGTPVGFTHIIYVYDLANQCQLGEVIGEHQIESTARACARNWAKNYGIEVSFFKMLPIKRNEVEIVR